MDIAGISAIVTGGASGLGAATVRGLAAAGAKLAILDMNAAAGEALAAEVGGSFHTVDVADDASVAQALDAVEAVHGIARVLVNCAGISPIDRTVRADGTPYPAATIQRVIGINLVGTLNMLVQFAARLARAELVGEERGVIVNTASIAAYDGPAGQLGYAASKAGVVGLTLPAARDLAEHAIRVMTVAPGMYRTPMVDMLDEAGKARLGQLVPHPRRLGRPEEFARLVLAIIDNPMLNGEVIRIDGAYRLP